jgi:hypothetical protein
VSIPSFSKIHPNAKSPDVPGAVDIAMGTTVVSTFRSLKKDVDARHKAGHDEAERT